ncbi:iron ABC transporter permease [Paenibacillus sp. Marseille-Q4541]|uniref:FecCD family ABC transporter permease n=1 Tax=Paenibacillus sp. Marseille-Q4541 TaxID=2831522 RepID=UPI001BA7D054|nr:iron ABC transporter permease [Paenibacillus sp. Marseille-Q4541]
MFKNKTISIPMIAKFIVGAILFVTAFMLAIVLGAADTSLKDAWSAITFGATNEAITMIREIRLPREIAAVLVGAALAVSGAIMQGMTRNPLADPGLLGITAGGNFALAVTLALLPSANYFTVMLACFVGTALGTLLVFGIGMLAKNGLTPVKLVLAGSAISAMLYALAEGISLYFRISKNVSMWTSGGLIGTTWGQLQLIIPFILIGLIVAMILSRQLTILSLNEEIAVGLGQNTKYIKIILLLVIIVLAGASVALVGSMAFIGLMVPHIVRFIIGTDYRYVLPMSAICGATFMLLADTLGRTIYAPYETPVAAIVAMLGLPFFLLIVNKGGKGY